MASDRRLNSVLVTNTQECRVSEDKFIARESNI